MRFLLFLPLLILAAPAQEPPAADHPPTAPPAAEENPFEVLEFQSGSILLPKKVARLELAEGYRYLNPDDARTVLERVPGSPPPGTKGIQGLVVPPNVAPGRAAGWLALIVYEEEGHIPEDAFSILDAELYESHLKSLAQEESKKLRAKKETVYEFEGFTGKLRYDPGAKIFSVGKRYWNERASNGDRGSPESEHWVLGRRGAVIVRGFFVGPTTLHDARGVAGMVRFLTGHRYEDFNATTDKEGTVLPAGKVLAAAGTQVGDGLWRVILRKLPWLLIIGVALLLKRWIDKIREA